MRPAPPRRARVRAPALVVVGERDRTIHPGEAASLAGALPQGRLVRIAGAGHLPHLERPEVVVPAVVGVRARMRPVPADDLLALALRAAGAAGELLADRFGDPATGIAAKSTRTDLVSDADREAEALIAGMIRAERPDDGLMGEEGAQESGASGLRWLVDPLDGTINYLWAVPQWSVSIACLDAEGPLVGVVYDPPRGETFTAVRGRGARRGDVALALSGGAELGEALLGTGFGYDAERRALQVRRLRTSCPRCATCAASAPPPSTWPGWPADGSTPSTRPGSTPGTRRPARCWWPRPAGRSSGSRRGTGCRRG